MCMGWVCEHVCVCVHWFRHVGTIRIKRPLSTLLTQSVYFHRPYEPIANHAFKMPMYVYLAKQHVIEPADCLGPRHSRTANQPA